MHEKKKRETDRRHTQAEREKIDKRRNSIICFRIFSFSTVGHMFVCTLLTEVAVFTLKDGGRGEREKQKVKGP